MTQDKPTIEGNKLIAAFMGDVTDNGKEWAVTNKRLVEKYEYHTSWDWLMPVVQKIKLLGNDRDVWESIEFYHVSNSPLVIDIEIAYDRIVSFITWYNQQNPKQ